MTRTCSNIRPNLIGNHPEIHPTALIDPSAQIIGNVKVGKNVFIAPLAVIRADEAGPNGKVEPIILEEECNLQDGVIIHSSGGDVVRIGARTSVGHGVAIHGPCTIGEDCFLAMRCSLYRTNLQNSVWIGMNAVVMQANLDAYTYVPAGTVIRSNTELQPVRFVSEKERIYMQHVLTATNRLREDYRRLLGKMS
jgi:carbonic anhydrase/acetyltransferase-like protein (isoleucine patch superfamily)